MIDWEILGAFFGLLILSGIMLSGTNLPVTGNFYKMEDTNSSFKQEYKLINWSESPDQDDFYGARHHEGLENLTAVEFNHSQDLINLSNQEVLEIEVSEENGTELNFSEKILGLNKSFTLSPNKTVNLRLREDITITSQVRNKTYKTSIKTRIESVKGSDKDTKSSNLSENIETYSTTYSGNITDARFNLKNDFNFSVNLNLSESLTTDNSNSNLSSGEEITVNGSRNQKKRLNRSSSVNGSSTETIEILILNQTEENGSEQSFEEESSGSGGQKENESFNDDELNSSEALEEKSNRSSEKAGENYLDNNESSVTAENSTESEIETEAGELVRIESERLGDFYIFKYEASRKDANLTSEGKSNIPVSQRGVEPWNDISQVEASKACQRLGEDYRLPRNKEWQAATGAVPDRPETLINGNTGDGSSVEEDSQQCKKSNNSAWNENYCLTGTGPEDWETSAGLDDMKGNLWEWVSNIVEVESSDFPEGESGWISTWKTDSAVPADFKSERSQGLQGSYYYAASEGSFAVRRGGAWHSDSRAGLFSMNLDRKETDSRSSIGFRCVYEPDS